MRRVHGPTTTGSSSIGANRRTPRAAPWPAAGATPRLRRDARRRLGSRAAPRARPATRSRRASAPGSRPATACRLSANLWLPGPDGRRPGRALPGRPRDDPVRQGQLAAQRRRGARDLSRPARLRPVPARRARHRVVGRRSRSTSTRADETRDGYDAVEWLAAQPWCTGAVGMWGISYGGFTSIQVAKLRPPHLRAIVPIQATDDRYLTDVHYVGGCVTASELSQYAVSQVAMNAMPPDPAIVGEGWRDGLDRPARGHAAVAVRVAPPAARRPVLAAGLARPRLRRDRRGGAQRRRLDGFVRRRGAPDAGRAAGRRRGRSSATGSTGCPSSATPGPNLDELHEIVRFFDRWLKGLAERGRRGTGGHLVRARVRRARAVPGRLAGALAGGRRPTRIRRSQPGRGRSPAARCRSSGRLRRRRRTPSAGVDRYRHRADGRDARGAVVGRRRAAQRPRARPPA